MTPERGAAPGLTGAARGTSRNGKTAIGQTTPGKTSSAAVKRFTASARDKLHNCSPEDLPEVRDALENEARELGIEEIEAHLILTRAMPRSPQNNHRTALRSSPNERVVASKLADVRSESVKWLWKDRIPFGMLTVLDGAPGTGKSTLALDIAARLTTGRAMPGSTRTVTPAPVMVLTSEDATAAIVRPRMEAAGADLNLVFVDPLVGASDGERITGQRSLTFPGDVGKLEEFVRSNHIGLVIIDVLMSFLEGTVDTHRDHSVRRALAPLAYMAEATGTALVAIRHLNKAAGGDAITRGGGSIGITGQARAVLLAAPHPEDPTGTRRVLAVTKCNIAPKTPSLAYSIADKSGASSIHWEGAVPYDANALLREGPGEYERSVRDQAGEIMREELRQGKKPLRELQDAVRNAGVSASPKTLQRAMDDLGVERKREGFGPGSKIMAIPPPAILDSSEDREGPVQYALASQNDTDLDVCEVKDGSAAHSGHPLGGVHYGDARAIGTVANHTDRAQPKQLNPNGAAL